MVIVALPSCWLLPVNSTRQACTWWVNSYAGPALGCTLNPTCRSSSSCTWYAAMPSPSSGSASAIRSSCLLSHGSSAPAKAAPALPVMLGEQLDLADFAQQHQSVVCGTDHSAVLRYLDSLTHPAAQSHSEHVPTSRLTTPKTHAYSRIS